MILFLGMEKDPALTQTYGYPIFEKIEIVFKSKCSVLQGVSGGRCLCSIVFFPLIILYFKYNSRPFIFLCFLSSQRDISCIPVFGQRGGRSDNQGSTH